ncbi:hypothetical protein G3435_13300 [Pseudomonas sp. MAFF212428]|uniref:DUF1311 domain-containing protein n=1 Tax=Pseudomonas brassicae TaxID=2708063 RepID=A0A6B3NJ79_9PSED|nr:hypothetical protein [Pseudomonas brassicae]NER60703.1 hypothetical protein [Pseudomonas brassicae]NER63285.1 hypothetical protein [Pseudomonas brassicae]
MKPAALLFSCALLTLALQTPTAVAAGFDCTKARTILENAICDTPSLSAKDDQLNALYNPLKTHKVFRELETRWLKDVRNVCTTPACLETAYDVQIRRLTPLPPPTPMAPDILAPLPKGAVYDKVEDAPWQRFALGTFAGMNEESVAQLIDVTVKDGVLHAYVYVSTAPDGDYYVLDRHHLQDTSGTLLEYVDNRPGWHVIARNVRFAGWSRSGLNDQGERYAGVQNGAFYYRQRGEGQLQDSFVYLIGSQQAPQPTTQAFFAYSNTVRFAKARVLETLNLENNGLRLAYEGKTDPGYETVMEADAGGWSLVNPTWSEQRPVLYFDNSGGFACIWRVDLLTKVLSKVVPEHEAVSARPVEINGREALVYVEQDKLMFAIAPDQ